MAKVPSDAQLVEWKEVFALLDRDGDGKVNKGELGRAMRAVGLMPTDEEVAAIAGTIKGNAFDFAGFSQILKSSWKPMVRGEEIKEAFRVFDKEGQGFVSCAEMRHVMTNLGEKLTEEEVDQLIHEGDDDGDGQIKYSDFVKQMMEAANF
jgi:calmodulin